MASRIIIVGAGTMGVSIARLFARHGWFVQVVEPDPDARGLVRKAVGPAHVVASTGETESADLAIECVPENAGLKRVVLRDLEDRVPEAAPILSNTSGLSLADISSEMRNPRRAAIAHFFNPGDVVPAVEVVTAPDTEDAFTEEVMQILRSVGKRPARLAQEIPGFVANRIQHAIMRECLHLVDVGIARPEEIDEIVRWSIGVRMAVSGPFRQRDLNGLDTHLEIARYLYPDLAAGASPSPTLKRHVEEGRLGRRAGRGFLDWSEETEDRSDEADLRAVLAALRGELAENET